MTVCDNGNGTSIRKFEEALTSIGDSIKSENKLGQFGFGLISPLGKCKRFTFTSAEAGREDGGYIRWTFDEGLIEQRTPKGIPYVEMPSLVYVPDGVPATPGRGKSPVWWRTQVRLVDITPDRIISRFDPQEFSNEALANFRQVMYRSSVKISVRYTAPDGSVSADKDIRASNYEGRELDVFKHTTKEGGDTSICLFLALNSTGKGRRGEVHFGRSDDDFRVSCKNFLNCVRGMLLPAVDQALSSGIFEGDIVCDNIDLDVNRKGFAKDSALKAMCESLEAWYEIVGKKYVDEITSQSNVKNWQIVGSIALKNIEDMLRENPDYQEIYNRFSLGHGKGNKKGPEIGDQDDTAIANRVPTNRGDGVDSDTGNGGSGGVSPKKDKPNRPANPLAGPLGDARKVVKGQSTGLQFRYVELASTEEIYDFDSKTGLLQFNTTNTNWMKCESNPWALMRYQEAVTRMALLLVPYENDVANYKSMRGLLQRSHKMEVQGLLNEGAARQRFKEIKKLNLPL